MVRLTRVIVRLCSEPLNLFNDYVHFGIPKAYNVYQLLTYNHYLKVLSLCVSITVSTLEYCTILLLLLNVLLFHARIWLLSVCALVVPLRCVSDYLWAELLHWFSLLPFHVIRGGACFHVLLCCVDGFVSLILICNYHKHGISCVWYWTYMMSVLAVLLLTVSCSGGCWSVCSGGWPSVLV
jgi:hypothetical protein